MHIEAATTLNSLLRESALYEVAISEKSRKQRIEKTRLGFSPHRGLGPKS